MITLHRLEPTGSADLAADLFRIARDCDRFGRDGAIDTAIERHRVRETSRRDAAISRRLDLASLLLFAPLGFFAACKLTGAL